MMQMIKNAGSNAQRRRILSVTFLVLVAAVLSYHAFFSIGYSYDANWNNVSVDTRVNITDSVPEILSVTVTDPITLSPGSTVTVQCNASIRDYNGGNTITNVSAILWDNASVAFSDADDNNDHYTNASCTTNTTSGYYANFTCQFTVYYYANPGTDWICNLSATDSHSFTGNISGTDWEINTTTVNELLALNVTPLIDYGNMAVGETSTPQEANVTNMGNGDINVSVRGYGAVEDDGLSFVCDVGNISIEHERFGLNETGDFGLDFTSLSSTFQNISGLMLPQQTNDSQQVINSTYWRLYVPPNPFGVCNGTVVFQAESAS